MIRALEGVLEHQSDGVGCDKRMRWYGGKTMIYAILVQRWAVDVLIRDIIPAGSAHASSADGGRDL